MVIRKRFLLATILVFVCLHFASAADQLADPLCVDSFITDINPTSVKIDEAFTVGIVLENCGTNTPNITRFEITLLSPDLSVKEPLVQEVGALTYANSQRFLTYHFRTKPAATPGEYVIKTKLTYGNGGLLFYKYDSFNVTVISDEAEFTLASAKINPAFPLEGQQFTLTLRVENFGKGDANSVKGNVGLPESFVGNKLAFLGQLTAGEDGILSYNFIPSQAGTFDYPFTVSYTDDFGKHDYVENLQITVKPQNDSNVRTVAIVVCVAIVVLILGIVLSRRRKQAKLIEQISSRRK